ncbi:cathepsin d (lysosomal aspartyl protease) [Plakobranchus ocellatus]|uniref:Cathepsin d (Lysosomal aspartyl protease) n=1 Tax=Plakobranchus ocellatus TaxID=259542 RepID=A0AAV4A5I9_9GAST|nr:cathepsin d (lysosomal aspartyl protease) [Plakobranchus ocellatus]
MASPQLGDVRLLGPSTGHCASGWTQTRYRRVPADLEDCLKMNLLSVTVLALTLIPVCAAHVINIPVSQTIKTSWNPTGILRQTWKASLEPLPQSARSQTRSGPKRSKPSVQLLSRPALPSELSQRPSSDRFSRPIIRDVKLTNYNNEIYYCTIELGTPGQKFDLAIHTSYPAMWVPSVHSPDDYSLSHFHRRYNNASSRTYQPKVKMFNAFFETRLLGGYWSQDTLTVAGLEVKNQTFGEVIVEPNMLEDMIFDGIFGLKPRGVAECAGPTVFENMVWQQLLPDRVFSLFLNRYYADGPESTLTLGGTNPDYYSGEFVYTPLTAPNRWQFKMEGIRIANHDGVINSTGFQAELDTGTPFIQGPRKVVDALHSMLGAKAHQGWPRTYSFDCSEVDSLPDVGFILNGLILPLTSKDYVIKEYKDGQVSCYSALQGMNWRKHETPVWVIGSAFMRAYYTKFDKDRSRVGFAKAKHTIPFIPS